VYIFFVIYHCFREYFVVVVVVVVVVDGYALMSGNQGCI